MVNAGARLLGVAAGALVGGYYGGGQGAMLGANMADRAFGMNEAPPISRAAERPALGFQ